MSNDALGGRHKELFLQKSKRIAASCLRRLEERPDTPEAMKPFFEALERTHVRFEPIARPSGQKLIGTLCAMVPPELIYATGATPTRLCAGSYTAYAIGDGAVPRDACPLVKAVMGFERAGVSPMYSECALWVVPVTCDGKKKLAGLLAAERPTVTLQVPPNKESDADTELYLRELYRLVPCLEQVTGKRLTAQSLAAAVDAVGRAQYELAVFSAYRRADPALLHGSQVMAMMNAFSCQRVEAWTESLRQLNRELAERARSGRTVGRAKQPRILLTGSPIVFPNVKVPLLIEELGGTLVADETCMGDRVLADPICVTDGSLDGMMRALANRSIRPCACPIFVRNEQRIFRVRRMLREANAQGVIYHVLRGCLTYDYEFRLLEEELPDVPILRLESDYNEEDVEQLRVRIEAFLEMIKFKDAKRRR